MPPREAARAASGRRFWQGGGAVALAAALLAACSSGSIRPKPAELPVNAPVIGVERVWTARLASAIDFPLQVAVRDGRVTLAGGNGTVVTLDGATGAELARTSLGEALSAGVGSDGTVSAVVTRGSQVVALEGAKQLWRYDLKTQSFTPPLVAGGRVFVLGADRSVTALDAQNGQLLWRIARSTEPLVLRQAGLLMAHGNTLVAGLSGRLAGIDPDTGSVLWEAPLAVSRGTNDVERLIDLLGGVSRQGDVVCARAFQTAVGCANVASGEVVWSKPAAGSVGVVGDADLVFGAESDGQVVAWRAASGERAWLSERLMWRDLTGPLVLGRSVILGDSQGWVHMLARVDGSHVNRMMTDSSGVAAPPVVAGNTLVVVTRAGGVYGFQPE
ncbi:MAG: outer membrane protein assembly factor BamB [Burkholderiaceae bacterium]|jgi:outer membrane assembly lipoprotein YfgL|nr:outer membrane protein assembly factor BamB [Burkholderiaceae bacterium]